MELIIVAGGEYAWFALQVFLASPKPSVHVEVNKETSY
jgi:hypothetical protein